jgi:hydroxyacylglutathione hydrolase
LSDLPGATRVCIAHEYALSSLKFARAVEPHNAEFIHYTRRCEETRAQNLPVRQ